MPLVNPPIIIKADIRQQKNIRKPIVTQNDTVIFQIEVLENGVPFDLSGATTISLANTRKKDGVTVVTPGTSAGNVATFNLGTNELERTGEVIAKAQFYDEEGRLSTLSFSYLVEGDPTGEGYVPSVDEMTLIETVLQDGPLIIEQANDALINVTETKYIEDYNVNTAYKKNNIVTFGGSSYIAKQDTTGNAPPALPATTNDYWGLAGRKGADGNGTVVRHRDEFIATAGQTVFTLSNSYDQFQNRIDVEVGGVPQFSPDNFIETSSTTITMSEGLAAGTRVIATYFSEAQPLGTDLETTVNSHTATINSNNNLLIAHTGRLDDVDQQLAETVYAKPGKKAITYAGVIRRDPTTGWFLIEDAVHESINYTAVSETVNNEILITYTDALKVGSMVVTPDETLAQYGVVCGGSVGDYQAFIKCFAPFSGTITNAGVLDVNPLFEGSASAVLSTDKSKLTITYDGAFHIKEKVMATAVSNNGTTFTGMNYHTNRVDDKNIEIRAFSPFYANIYYDGTTWLVSTSCKTTITPTWDATANELLITHDGIPGGAGYVAFQDIVLTLRKSLSGSLIHARVVSLTQTTIRVEFYNNAGVKITTPSTDMRIYVSRPSFKVPHEIPTGARIFFDFGLSIVRPAKLAIPGGNLWLLGMHLK